ncbi:MAG TPA: peroxide stress protein YaaA [Acidimicrobiales bacterium]
MPSRPPLILLPPSEGKAGGGTGPPWVAGSMSSPELDVRRARVMAALVTAMRASKAARAKLLGVKGEALAAATETNRLVAHGPTLPAVERYTGVLAQALDYASLPAAQQRRVDRQVRIFSGLWGVAAPTDPVPDYKLKMGASLGRLGKLSTWWRPAVTAALAPALAGRTVWDLLANEHRAAWDPDLTGGPDAPRVVISVRFAEEVRRGGGTGGHRELVTVAHWNKLLKGALVRHVVATQLADVDGLAGFVHPLGYAYDAELTEASDDGLRVTATLVKRD